MHFHILGGAQCRVYAFVSELASVCVMLFLLGGLFQEFFAEYLRNPLGYSFRYFRYPSMIEQNNSLVIAVPQCVVIQPEIVSDSARFGKILERVSVGIHYTFKRVGMAASAHAV